MVQRVRDRAGGSVAAWVPTIHWQSKGSHRSIVTGYCINETPQGPCIGVHQVGALFTPLVMMENDDSLSTFFSNTFLIAWDSVVQRLAMYMRINSDCLPISGLHVE